MDQPTKHATMLVHECTKQSTWYTNQVLGAAGQTSQLAGAVAPAVGVMQPASPSEGTREADSLLNGGQSCACYTASLHHLAQHNQLAPPNQKLHYISSPHPAVSHTLPAIKGLPVHARTAAHTHSIVAQALFTQHTQAHRLAGNDTADGPTATIKQ